MSAILTLLLSSAAPFAASYALTKVTGILGQHWWGRLLVSAARRKLEASRLDAAATALQKLAATTPLTEEQKARLTPDELDAINHVRAHAPLTTPPATTPSAAQAEG